MESHINLGLQGELASFLISPPRLLCWFGQAFCRLPGEVGIHYGAILGSNPWVLSLCLRIQLEAI